MRIDEIPGLARLTVAEKILLLEDLWDSIAADESSVPVPQSHRAELDRRLAEHEQDPGWLLMLDDLRGLLSACCFEGGARGGCSLLLSQPHG